MWVYTDSEQLSITHSHHPCPSQCNLFLGLKASLPSLLSLAQSCGFNTLRAGGFILKLSFKEVNVPVQSVFSLLSINIWIPPGDPLQAPLHPGLELLWSLILQWTPSCVIHLDHTGLRFIEHGSKASGLFYHCPAWLHLFVLICEPDAPPIVHVLFFFIIRTWVFVWCCNQCTYILSPQQMLKYDLPIKHYLFGSLLFYKIVHGIFYLSTACLHSHL